MMEPPGAAADFSPFTGLPDEIVLEIVNKIFELKWLCFCKLVSKRFYSIVHKVDKISFTAQSDSDWKTCKCNATFIPEALKPYCSFCTSVVKSMSMFSCIKSLHIKLPIWSQQESLVSQWKFKFSNKGDSFIFLSPGSLYFYVKDQDVVVLEEEDEVISENILDFAIDKCYCDAIRRFLMFFDNISNFPFLEKVSIRDYGNRGRISINGGGEKITGRYNPESPRRYCMCYIPLLKLPVSGIIMEDVTLVFFESSGLLDGDESFEDDEFQDYREAVYGEAITEIFKKHRGCIQNIELPRP